MRLHRISVAIVAASALILTACSNDAMPADSGTQEDALPSQLVTITHGTNTSVYAELAAVAEAMTQKQGISFRILNSDTGVGRIAPLVEGQVDIARTGEEYIYAFEADSEFAVEEWGPQDVNVVWTPTTIVGFLVKEDSKIDSIEDLRGKRIPLVTAHQSANNKIEALLAYAGLEWKDVQTVDLGYGEQGAALAAGQVDAILLGIYAAEAYQLDTTEGVRWLGMDLENAAGIAAMQKVSPAVLVDEFKEAAAPDASGTVVGMHYPIPLIALAETSEKMVYELVTLIHEDYDSYKDATPTMSNWSIANMPISPGEVPFHKGFVRFLKEQGVWTAEAEARNAELIERGRSLREGWPSFLEKANKEHLVNEWEEWKAANLPPK